MKSFSAALILMSFPLFSFSSVNEITVDFSEKFQTIDCFGASDAWSMEPLGKYWDEENKSAVADLLFSQENGIGLTGWRFNIGAGSIETDQEIIGNPWRMAECFKQTKDGAYDWSKQEGQQWFLQAAKEKGVENFVGFSNSPPVWMTKNKHGQCDETVGSTNLEEGYETEFAIFLVDVYEHFKNEKDIILNFISPINEPTWEWNDSWQEGCRYNNEDAKKVYNALYEELGRRGLQHETEIDGTEGVEITAMLDDDLYEEFSDSKKYRSGCNSNPIKYPGKYREYLKDFLGDEDMRQALSNKISYHAYWGDDPDRMGELRDIFNDNIERYSDSYTKVWMSEYCILGDAGPGRDLGMDSALHVARVIHRDLTRVNASAWFWWTAVSKEDYKDGLIYTDFVNEGDNQNIIESKLLWTFGNYSKFIRPGYQRISCIGADDLDGLMASAYIGEDSKELIIVVINYSNSQQDIKFNIELPDGYVLNDLVPYTTSSDEDLNKGNCFDSKLNYKIPARSIVTFIGNLEQEDVHVL